MKQTHNAYVCYVDGSRELVSYTVSDKPSKECISIGLCDELIDLFEEFGSTLYFKFPTKLFKELLYDPSYRIQQEPDDLISMRNKSAAIVALSDLALESKTWSEFCKKAATLMEIPASRFEPKCSVVLRKIIWNVGDPTSSDIPDQLKQYFKDHYEDHPDHKTQSK